jgi:hypothetical protein
MTSVVNLHVADGDYGFLGLGGNTALRGSGQNSHFDGNVGVGIPYPGMRLDVKSTGTGDVLGITSSDDDPLVTAGENPNGAGLLSVYSFLGGETVRIAGQYSTYFLSGNVGFGTSNPLYPLHVVDEGHALCVEHQYGPYHGIQVIGEIGTIGEGGNLAGYFGDDLHVSGAVIYTSGSFVIDHPLFPETETLRHSIVESPEGLLIYRGEVRLDAGGRAAVSLPTYFTSLTEETDASIFLTPRGGPFPVRAAWDPDHGGFTVTGAPNRSVFWKVLAGRGDPVWQQIKRPVEQQKGQDNQLCDSGKLLHPELYGYPETRSMRFEKRTGK